MSRLDDVCTHERYPRSNRYDAAWVREHQMGPHPLWLAEFLCERMSIEPHHRVLDLGCGKALTSIFLAREFGAQVWACDLWVDPTDNARRVSEAGLAGEVFPLKAEAHSLPFAEGFFDRIVSVDAYHYFGTDDLYVGYLSRFLCEGGRLGIVSPSFAGDACAVPEALAAYWDWELCSLHPPDWWRAHWSKTGRVVVESADAVPNGWKDWVRWLEFVTPEMDPGELKDSFEKEIELLRADAGRTLGFARVVGRKAAGG